MSVAIRPQPPIQPEPPSGLVDKASRVAALVDSVRKEVDQWLVDELAQLQARQAVSRTAMADAVMSAASRAAEARADLRQLVKLQASPARRVGGAFARRLHWAWRWTLARMGAPGQAWLIRRCGLWRPGRASGGLPAVFAYARRKADPAAVPASLLDQAWYLERYPDVAGLALSPLLHYLVVGQGEGRNPHPLFSTNFYGRRYAAELAQDRVWPLAHFLRAGSAALFDPHPLFDAVHYAAQGGRPAPGEDLVTHYLREGWRRKLSPHPLFDLDWYACQAGIPDDVPPLLHYVLEGAAAGVSPHPLFEPDWYRAQAPDAGVDLLSHYIETGAALGLSPSRWFDAQHYVAQAGAQAEVNPLVDYLQGGAWRVAEPTSGFATAAYVAAHPELVRQGLTPLEHWARAAAERRQAD